MKLLSRTEEVLLIAVCRLQSDAFALTIRKEVENLTSQSFSVGGIYVPLDRLVRKGMLRTQEESGSPDRQGRPRRRFAITSQGVAALSEVRELHRTMWAGLPDSLATRLQFGF